MMKTGNLLGCVFTCVVSVFLLMARANAEEFTLRIGAGHPTPGLVYVYAADTYFVPEVEKRVRERTGHKVRFVKAWAGTIAKPDSIIDAVQKGSLDVGLNVVAFELGRIRLLNFGYYFPFSPDEMRSQQLSMKVLKEIPALQESVEPYNIRILYLAPTDEYGMITKFKIDRMADIAGKRIACAGANAPWVQAAGGVPVQLPVSENYQGLQTGMIDGNVYTASGLTSFRLVEVAKYYTDTGFGAIVGGIGAYMNLDTRKKLPREIVDIIDEVSVETSLKTAEISKLRNSEALAQAGVAGGTVSVLAEAERSRWAELLKDMPAKGAREADEQGLPGTQVYQAFMQMVKESGYKFPYEYQLR